MKIYFYFAKQFVIDTCLPFSVIYIGQLSSKAFKYLNPCRYDIRWDSTL